jgi:hypothetical protein
LVIPRWLEQISSRPNPSAVLKWSVRSLVAHHIGRKQNDVQMLRYSEAAYGRALVGLQNALNHAGVCRSSDTLCAAMILGFYEVRCCGFCGLDVGVGLLGRGSFLLGAGVGILG